MYCRIGTKIINALLMIPAIGMIDIENASTFGALILLIINLLLCYVYERSIDHERDEAEWQKGIFK
jgi:hypothetical protein